MANVCSFNRKDGFYCYRYIIIYPGIDDFHMSIINSGHETDKQNYSYAQYDMSGINTLLRPFGIQYDLSNLIILEYTMERKHRMNDAPAWVIRNPEGYYWSDVYKRVAYAGGFPYENATSDN